MPSRCSGARLLLGCCPFISLPHGRRHSLAPAKGCPSAFQLGPHQPSVPRLPLPLRGAPAPLPIGVGAPDARTPGCAPSFLAAGRLLWNGQQRRARAGRLVGGVRAALRRDGGLRCVSHAALHGLCCMRRTCAPAQPRAAVCSCMQACCPAWGNAWRPHAAGNALVGRALAGTCGLGATPVTRRLFRCWRFLVASPPDEPVTAVLCQHPLPRSWNYCPSDAPSGCTVPGYIWCVLRGLLCLLWSPSWLPTGAWAGHVAVWLHARRCFPHPATPRPHSTAPASPS